MYKVARYEVTFIAKGGKSVTRDFHSIDSDFEVGLKVKELQMDPRLPEWRGPGMLIVRKITTEEIFAREFKT